MSSYDHVTLVDGLADAVSQVMCSDSVKSLKELGVFFDIAPKTQNRTAPAAIRHGDDRFGIASWALTPLYVEGKKRLLANSEDHCAASALLVASPDYTTAWNVRKSKLVAERVEAELLFCALILQRSPKSAESWSHRSWVLRRFGCSQQQALKELELAWLAASRAQNNYYAGVHRLRVLGMTEASVLQSEVRRSRLWLRSHVGDSSGWWYHRLVFEKGHAVRVLPLDEEIAYCSEMFEHYGKSHECLRMHRKWMSSVEAKASE